MIKINLLGDEVKADSSAILWLAGIAVSFIGFFMVTVFLYFDVTNQLTIRKQEVEDLEKQLAQLKEKTKEVSGLEAKRKELNSKLAVIAELKLSLAYRGSGERKLDTDLRICPGRPNGRRLHG